MYTNFIKYFLHLGVSLMQLYEYRSKYGDCTTFLTNNDTESNAMIIFNGMKYDLPPWSINILPSCTTEAYNTAKDAAKQIFKEAAGVVVVDDRASNLFPTPLEVFNKGDVAVGRISQDLSQEGNHGGVLRLLAALPPEPNPLKAMAAVISSSCSVHSPPPTPKIPKAPKSSNFLQIPKNTNSALVSRTRFIMRRNALFGMLLSTLTFPFLELQSSAETDLLGSFRAYEDETNKFRILVPEGWLVGAGGSKSIKSVTAFYPDEASDSNVCITITGLSPDFTTLGSFGKVDAFAENLVGGLDRS